LLMLRFGGRAGIKKTKLVIDKTEQLITRWNAANPSYRVE
jgi:hypothetical protein